MTNSPHGLQTLSHSRSTLGWPFGTAQAAQSENLERSIETADGKPKPRTQCLSALATAGGWSKMRDELLAGEREPIERVLLPAAVLDPSGQASPAERQPCRTAGASFTAARVLGRGRRRA